MKSRPWIFILVLLLSGAAIYGLNQLKNAKISSSATKKALYYCPMHPSYTSDRPGNCPICNMKLVKRDERSREEHLKEHTHAGENSTEPLRTFSVQELVNMKPGEICLLHKCKMGQCLIAMTEETARLGKCPHCGEDLGVVVKDLAPEGYTAVRLAPDKQQIAGIKTAPVQRKKMSKTVRAVGRIAHDPELYQAQQEFIQALEADKRAAEGGIEEIREQSQKLLDSTRLRLKLMGLSEELVGEIEKAGKPDRALLYSEPGQKAWLYAPIYEYEIPLVKAGQKVEVTVSTFTDKKFEGLIRSLDPVLDPVTRTVRVRAQLDNPEGLLKPEMYVNATLVADLGEVLAIPEEAVFVTGKENIVFVAKSEGVFEPRNVVLGVKTDPYYEIKSGVSEGESVVTSGNFLIDSESRLKAAFENIGSSGPGGHQHGG